MEKPKNMAEGPDSWDYTLKPYFLNFFPFQRILNGRGSRTLGHLLSNPFNMLYPNLAFFI